MLAIKNLTNNKKRTTLTVISVTLAAVLLLSVGLIFSSIRDYMIKSVLKTEGNYHVSIKAEKISHPNIVKVIKKESKYFVFFNNIKNTHKYTSEICENYKCEDITYNEKLLSLYGVSQNKNLISSFKTILIITLSVLSLGVSILIYNSFMTSLIERKKQIGVLKSIGMTKKQIIKVTLQESLIILIISLPIGLIISTWLTQILLTLMNYLLKDMLEYKITLNFYPSFISISLLFITIIIFICSLIPSLKITKISIIDTIRGVDNYQLKKVKKHKKILSTLAHNNYYRCKKKYRPISLAIFIGILLYTTFSLYLNYGLNSINTKKTNYNYQITLQGNQEQIKSFSPKITYKMCIKEGTIPKEDYLEKTYYQETKNLIIIENSQNKVINKMKSPPNQKYLKKEITLNNTKIKTTEQIPYGLEQFLTQDNIVYLTNNFKDQCPNYLITAFINKNINNFEEKITNFAKENNLEISYVNYQKANILTNNLILAIKIVLYSLVILMALIGVTSIINITESSINSRSQEISALKSIGITKKQLNKLLRKEAYYVVRKTFIFTGIIVLIINYILYQAINQTIKSDFIIPYKEIIISYVISYALIYQTLKNGHKRFKEENIIKYITNKQ